MEDASNTRWWCYLYTCVVRLNPSPSPESVEELRFTDHRTELDDDFARDEHLGLPRLLIRGQGTVLQDANQKNAPVS